MYGRDGALLTVGDNILFDPVAGRLLVSLQDSCTTSTGYSCPASNYGAGWWIMALNGLPTLFEILQTYTPTADALQFRVPTYPESLRSADQFDTYWGNV